MASIGKTFMRHWYTQNIDTMYDIDRKGTRQIPKKQIGYQNRKYQEISEIQRISKREVARKSWIT